MKKKYTLSLILLITIQGILFLGNASAQNVGIGTATPSEKLDVLGNLKFSGALMPNNNAGTTGRILMSAGAGVPPTWVTATNLLYNNTFVAYSTGGITTNSSWQVIPGMSITATVPSGMNAKILVHADLGIATTSTVQPSGTDIAIYMNGTWTPGSAGYKRVYLRPGTINTENNVFGNPSMDIVQTVGAGTYTFDVRGWQQLTGGGSSSAVVGGASGSVFQGSLIVMVILQ